MEGIFTKLVDQFVDGKISRRGLIQSLAAAAAVTAQKEAFAASPGRRELKAIGVNHISYQCKDYAKLRDFYVGTFGMKVLRETGTQASLGFGGSTLIVRNGKGETPMIDHIAFNIADYGNEKTDPATFKANNEAVKAELDARGLKAEPESELSWRFRDPEGFVVQVTPELMHPGNPMFDRIFSPSKK
jgi:catechol 2,3-dioxygenase-like lactoylglutathione lyase family enzyme